MCTPRKITCCCFSHSLWVLVTGDTTGGVLVAKTTDSGSTTFYALELLPNGGDFLIRFSYLPASQTVIHTMLSYSCVEALKRYFLSLALRVWRCQLCSLLWPMVTGTLWQLWLVVVWPPSIWMPLESTPGVYHAKRMYFNTGF